MRFLLGNSPASEFHMSTFRCTLFHLHGQVGMKGEIKKTGLKFRQAKVVTGPSGFLFRQTLDKFYGSIELI